MEKSAVDGLLSGGAVQLEQFLAALQDDINEKLAGQNKEILELRSALDNTQKTLSSTQTELKAVKQPYKDLNLTVNGVSSKVTNQATSVAAIQASIKDLERRVNE